MSGDEAFYNIDEEEKLQGAVLTHVDHFTIEGNYIFLEKAMKGISETWLVLEVQSDKF